MDEHRLGLKPILGKVWAKRGESLVVRVQHRYEWLYLYAFACPEQGHSHFWILPGVNTVAFECVLNAFARDNGVGPDKHIVLVLDQAGWHVSKKLKVPEGLTLVFLPSHSPELQRLGESGTFRASPPAERLWSLTDVPLVNRHFDTLEHLQHTLEPHLTQLETQTQRVRAQTLFHWWPRTTLPI